MKRIPKHYILILIFSLSAVVSLAQSPSADTLKGSIYEEGSNKAIVNAQIEIEGYKKFKTTTNSKGQFFLVLPSFLMKESSLVMLIKIELQEGKRPFQIRGGINPRLNNLKIPVRLPKTSTESETTQNLQEDLEEHNDIINERDFDLQANDNSDSTIQEVYANNSANDADLEFEPGDQYFLYNSRSLLERIKNSGRLLDEIEQLKKSDAGFINKYFKLVGGLKKIDLQLENLSYFSVSTEQNLKLLDTLEHELHDLTDQLNKRNYKASLISKLDSLEDQMSGLASYLFEKNQFQDMLLKEAQSEIDRLRSLLENRNAFMLLDRKLTLSLLVAFLITICVLGITTYLWIRIRRQRNQLIYQNHKIADQRDELQAMSESLKDMLIHREILLKEVHHRVKNNLQMIWSLLFLQSRRIKDKTALWALDNSRSRVYSITLVHEKLYQSDNLAQIDLFQYLKELVASISDTYDHVEQEIKYDLQIPAVYFGIDHTMRLGLIINELISNIYKYAFPNQSEGKVLIQLKEQNPEFYELVVQDNGVGIPENIDTKKGKGLGLRMVYLLSRELRGTLSFEKINGTRVTIKFKKASKN